MPGMSISNFQRFTSAIMVLDTDRSGAVDLDKGILTEVNAIKQEIDAMDPFPNDMPTLSPSLVSLDITACHTVIIKNKRAPIFLMMHVSPSSVLGISNHIQKGKASAYRDFSTTGNDFNASLHPPFRLKVSDEVDVTVVQSPQFRHFDEAKFRSEIGCRVDKLRVLSIPSDIEVVDQGGTHTELTIAPDGPVQSKIVSTNITYSTGYLCRTDTLVVSGIKQNKEKVIYVIRNLFSQASNQFVQLAPLDIKPLALKLFNPTQDNEKKELVELAWQKLSQSQNLEQILTTIANTFKKKYLDAVVVLFLNDHHTAH